MAIFRLIYELSSWHIVDVDAENEEEAKEIIMFGEEESDRVTKVDEGYLFDGIQVINDESGT